MVRQWPHRDDGPGGKPVFVTKAAGDKLVQPFDEAEERRLIEHGCLQERTQPWSLPHPAPNNARAVRVQVVCTWRLCALATAVRWPCEQEDMGAAPVGWQRWRRPLRQQTRNQVVVFSGRERLHLKVIACTQLILTGWLLWLCG